MKKLMLAMIGTAACSMMTGCVSSAVTKGGSYANLPDPKPDEYLIHWENGDNRIEAEASVYTVLSMFGGGDDAPWMLRDEANYSFFGRIYTLEDKARNAALYKACQQAKCDALIGAEYIVETKNYGVYSSAKCKVKGWPASITGIEKVAKKAK